MKSRSGRLVFRFDLRTILVLVIALAIVFGLVAREVHPENWKKRNAAEVRRLGGRVHYNPTPKNKQTGVVNGYLRVFLGDEYFGEVDSVHLKPRTAEDLDLLLAFPEMQFLALTGAPVTDDLLNGLRGLPQLDRLSLGEATLSERGLKSLTELPNLGLLQFTNCALSAQSLKLLKELPKLRAVEFTNCLMSDETLTPLTQSSILYLSFRNCSIGDSNLRSMHGSRSSVHLRLEMTNVTEAGILAIREANPAWSVRFSTGKDNEYPTDYGNLLPSIQELPQVDKLIFMGSLTSDATLGILKDASSLASLQFSKCLVTDDGLQSLRPLQNLKSLSIRGAPITDEGLRALEGMTKLQFVSLQGTKIEGVGLGSLPSSITTLLSDATDRGVAEIARLTNLEELWLLHTIVSDEGIENIAKMDSLRRLYFFETSISDSGVSRLKRALPICVISTE